MILSSTTPKLCRLLPLVVAMTTLGGGCSLVTPFDVAAAADSGADGDGDADADGEGDGDSVVDADQTGDARIDADEEVEPWDPTLSCVGGDTDEQWVVAALDGGVVRSYVTGRDWQDPRELCTRCIVTAISPDGSRALALVYTGDVERVFDDIALVDLHAPGRGVEPLGIQGAQPAWIDDDTIVYVVAYEWEGICDVDPPPSTPERVQAHVLGLGSGVDTPVGEPLHRAWADASPLVTLDGRHLVIVSNAQSRCSGNKHGVSIVSLDSGEATTLAWTFHFDGDEPDFTFGLLPGGEGFLVQTVTDGAHRLSKVYATRLDGEATPVATGPEESRIFASHDWDVVGGVATGRWGHCATVRRLGPACELYCRVPDSERWQRRTVRGGAPVDLPDHSALGEEVRIMDVRQVAAP